MIGLTGIGIGVKQGRITIDDLPYYKVPFKWLMTKEDKVDLDKKVVEQKPLLAIDFATVDTLNMLKTGETYAEAFKGLFTNDEVMESIINGKSTQDEAIRAALPQFSIESIKEQLISAERQLSGLKFPEVSAINLISFSDDLDDDDARVQKFSFEIKVLTDEGGIFGIPMTLVIHANPGQSSIKIHIGKQSENSSRGLTADSGLLTTEDGKIMNQVVSRFYSKVNNKNVYKRFVEENAKSNLQRFMDEMNINVDKAAIKELFIATQGEVSKSSVRGYTIDDNEGLATTTIRFNNNSATEKTNYELKFSRIDNEITELNKMEGK